MNHTLKLVRDPFPDDPSEGNAVDAHLLRIYWNKKELEDFLPGLAQRCTSQEIVAIVLSQLGNVEREAINALKQIGRNGGC